MGRMDMHSTNRCPKALVGDDLKAGKNGKVDLLDEYRPGEVLMSLRTVAVVSLFSRGFLSVFQPFPGALFPECEWP